MFKNLQQSLLREHLALTFLGQYLPGKLRYHHKKFLDRRYQLGACSM